MVYVHDDRWALKLYTAPVAEPVTLTEAKAQLRVDGTDDDTFITSIISVARRQVENETNRALISQTWEMALDKFPCDRYMKIPRPPLQSITSVTYYDLAGASYVMPATDYLVDTYSEPGRVALKNAASWPGTALREANGVIIRFVAGYGAAGTSVPDEIRQAILLLIGHLYENREAVNDGRNVQTLPLGVDRLLMPMRIIPM
jgi:uncharacterized phiE125 gp8 family phage protein